MKLPDYKEKIIALQKEISFYETKMKKEFIEPIWNDIDKLNNIISELPDCITKFYIYQRLEELKKG